MYIFLLKKVIIVSYLLYIYWQPDEDIWYVEKRFLFDSACQMAYTNVQKSAPRTIVTRYKLLGKNISRGVNFLYFQIAYFFT